MNFGDVLANAAAVWFLVKSVEVVPFALYDTFMFIKRVMSAISHKVGKGIVDVEDQDVTSTEEQDDASTDQDSNFEEAEDLQYDRTRGMFEYIFSGDGFFDFSLLREGSVLPGGWSLFLISVLFPFVMFVLEMASIYLGSETEICEKSADLDRVAGPCLELFGTGQRENNMEQLFNQSFGGSSSNRLCVKWTSNYRGVKYASSICGFSPSVDEDIALLLKVFPSNHWIGHLLPKSISKKKLKYPSILLSMPFENSTTGVTMVGTVQFDAEVKVNGKGSLLQDVIRIGQVSEETKEKMRADVALFQNLRNITGARYFEDDNFFGIQWRTVEDFENGVDALTLSVLAQATRGPIKTASMMSSANLERPPHEFEVSCTQDFLLSKKMSLSIILTSIGVRALLVFLPSSMSSVKFALYSTRGAENANGRA